SSMPHLNSLRNLEQSTLPSTQSIALIKMNRRWITVGVAVLLAALTWVVFGQTLRHDFVNYDDQRYVYQNTKITGGLSAAGIVWAFTHVHSENWHPLTTISHMLDCQLYGLKAGGHHFTNLLLHAIGAILLRSEEHTSELQSLRHL